MYFPVLEAQFLFFLVVFTDLILINKISVELQPKGAFNTDH